MVLGWGSNWNKKRTVTGGSSWLSKVPRKDQKERVGDLQPRGRDHTDTCIWKACWAAQLGPLVAASLQTRPQNPHTYSLPPDCCQQEEGLTGRCPSSNGPAFTRASSATRSPVCLLLGRSQICPSLVRTCSPSVSTARKEKRSCWEGRNAHPGAVSGPSAKGLCFLAWLVLSCIMERSS